MSSSFKDKDKCIKMKMKNEEKVFFVSFLSKNAVSSSSFYLKMKVTKKMVKMKIMAERMKEDEDDNEGEKRN